MAKGLLTEPRSLKEQWMKKERIVPLVVALVSVIVLPYLHLGVIYNYWISKTYEVNRHSCHCSCWDTIFKGSYETKIAGYKHVYFNVTSNTFKIWTITIVAAIALYETLRYLVHLALTSCLRKSMLLLFLIVLYPHYYTWWSYFNYLNDDFYKQWYHQTFFSVTELISTCAVLYLADRRRPIQPRLLLVIVDVALLHIISAGGDQFISNVFLARGEWHQWVRDIGFMLPDIVNVFIPLIELKLWCRLNNQTLFASVSTVEMVCSVLAILILWLGLQHL